MSKGFKRPDSDAYLEGMERAESEGWADRVVTLADCRAVEEGCYFDFVAAERAVEFFPAFLQHSKGEWAGKPFHLQPWQRRETETIFGWLKTENERRFKTAYIEVPKKNGKSTWAAGCAVYLLTMDGEAGAEVYTAGLAQKQAKIVFDEARRMVESSPELMQKLSIFKSTNTITYPANGSKFAALSRQTGVQEGLNTSGLIADEMHVWNRDLWEPLEFSTSGRRQPLKIIITTAGEYDPESIGWEMHERARGYLDSTREMTAFYGKIFAADPDDDPGDPEVWRKSNPSLGVILSEDNYRKDYEEAVGDPISLASFRRYRQNVWRQQLVSAVPLDRWDECRSDCTVADLEGLSVFGGLDFSEVYDLTAFVAVAQYEDEVFLVSRFWLPEDRARAAGGSKNWRLYDRWAREGFLTLTPDDTVEYKAIRNEIIELNDTLFFDDIGVDRWNANETMNILEENGIPVAGVPQRASHLSEPFRRLITLVRQRKIRHDGNPVMRWCISNVAAKENYTEEIIPIKLAAENKIDGVSAAVDAFAAMLPHWVEDHGAEIGDPIVV